MTTLILVVALVGALGVAGILGASIMASNSQSKIPDGAESWPTTEGTVRGSGMAAVSRYTQLPWFDFSYVVDGEYYSGTFMLSASGDRANELLREMDDKKFKVCFDPTNPTKFYIADETIEGCEVKFRTGASLTP